MGAQRPGVDATEFAGRLAQAVDGASGKWHAAGRQQFEPALAHVVVDGLGGDVTRHRSGLHAQAAAAQFDAVALLIPHGTPGLATHFELQFGVHRAAVGELEFERAAGESLEQRNVHVCGGACQRTGRRGCVRIRAATATFGQRLLVADGDRRFVQLTQQMRHRALGQSGDRQQRVDAERGRHDRAVEHKEPRPPRPRRAPDAATMVDHAGVEVVGHRATAQRVHGEHGAWRLGAGHQLVGRRRHQLPAQGVQVHAAAGLRAGEDARLFAVGVELGRVTRPQRHRGVPVGQAHEVARRAVVAHRQQRKRMRAEGPAGGAGQWVHARSGARCAVAVALELVQRVGGGQCFARDARDGAGGRAVFNDEPARHREALAVSGHRGGRGGSGGGGVTPQINHARDGRPHRHTARARAIAFSVHGLGHVGHETQGVAVARKTRTQCRREGERLARQGLAALQQLGAAEGAGGDEQAPCAHAQRVGACCRMRRRGIDADAFGGQHGDQPATIVQWGDAPGAGTANYQCTVTRGASEVSVAQRQLGTGDVAAGGAIAAARAARGVDGECHRCGAGAGFEEGRQPRQRGRFGQQG